MDFSAVRVKKLVVLREILSFDWKKLLSLLYYKVHMI